MTNPSVYIGIDPTAGIRPSTFAILNERLKIEKIGRASNDELIEIVTAYPAAVCAVDAPIGPAKGLLAETEYRRRLGLEPNRTNYSTLRVCEYELRRRKISLYITPKDSNQAPQWMKEGWRLYDGLRKAGFVEYPRAGERQMFETYPHAAFTVLVGKRPYSKSSIEGLLQRQLILFEEGVDVPDPMPHLEEWTRHRIKTGQIGREHVLDHDSLDALMAAYTAYVVDKEPRSVTALGDAAEGQLVLPVGSLKDLY